MTDDLPEYYFRIRDTGAAVFRIDAGNRQRRLEMEEIAVVNIRNGNIRPHGNRTLEQAELARIRAWMNERTTLLEQREFDEILQTVDRLNTTTQWVQSRASDDQIDAVANALLLAMHDLRSTLVRKQAERIAPATDEGE